MARKTGTDAKTVLCVVDRRRNPISRLLRNAGLLVIESFTLDQAVALCISSHVDCVVLDQEFFVETDGWSVAQSMKLVRPKICILLVSRAVRLQNAAPKGVDRIESARKPQAVVQAVLELCGAAAKRRGAAGS